jgi:hypothetical protein
MKAAAVAMWLETAGVSVQHPAVEDAALFFVLLAAFHCAVHGTLFVSTSVLIRFAFLWCVIQRHTGSSSA